MKANPDRDRTVEQLSALAHSTRFEVFRALMRAGNEGLSAGTIAEFLEIAPNTLSNHLAILQRAGLTAVRRDGRRLIYAAEIGAITSLVEAMVRDCCDGHPEVCKPLTNASTVDCS
ncbi:ArsR/SmtB family transcription factor [Parvularcula oceani]|uniref:ArsR/SmtB family transcription factor n=1 Tax=Parvularcula oceani TaxID=1247963 RepID=UPI0004E1B787|nr:metalloregulator ArsR/SmtB family transcription factor [Parvularcula oceani]